jgi:hypothetical protein
MKIRAVSKFLSLASLISHFFCCFLPGVISLITLITLSGATVITMEDFGIPEYVHEKMIYISFVVLIVSGLANIVSYKIDCREMGCVHGACAPKKSKYFKLYAYSVVFFLLNAVIHFTLHTHEHHDHHDHEKHHEEVHVSTK